MTVRSQCWQLTGEFYAMCCELSRERGRGKGGRGRACVVVVANCRFVSFSSAVPGREGKKD